MGRTVQHSCPEVRSAVQVGNRLAGAGAVSSHRLPHALRTGLTSPSTRSPGVADD